MVVTAGVMASLGTAASDHTELRGVWIAASMLVTLGFLGAGLYAWARWPGNRVGPLMVAVAFSWVVSDFVFSNSPVLFTVGSALSLFYIAVMVHLLLVFPAGRFERRFDRGIAIACYVAAGPLYLAAFAFADPAEFGCEECPQNVMLIAADKPLADALALVVSVVFAVSAIALAVRLLMRRRRATPVQRQALTAVVFAGLALAVLLFAATTIVPITGGDATFASVLGIASLVPFALVPYLFAGSLARTRILRGGAFRRLVDELSRAPGPDDLREALARTLGDPSVELAYWIPESNAFAGADAGAEGRAVTEIRVEDRRVAAIVHDAALLDDPELVRGVAAAAALALENARLDAELRAKVEELRASRARMLEATLDERRRLERDLHDGAQQRLVSLALGLRVADARLADDPASAREILQSVGGELEAALAELRELARGIHPAVLSTRGLDAALETVANRAPLPVELEVSVGERLPEPVELAAYFVVTEALTNVAKYAGASHAGVRAIRRDGRLLVEVADDGVGGADPTRGSGLRGLADRVAALDGTLELRSDTGGGTVVRAEIPVGNGAAGHGTLRSSASL